MSDQLVEEHRKMITVTGNLSDFQINNLRNWPYVLFDHDDVDGISLSYDFTNSMEEQESEGSGGQLYAGRVVYDFSFKNLAKYDSDGLKKRIEQLTHWVKYLFWVDTEVVIRKEGKEWQI